MVGECQDRLKMFSIVGLMLLSHKPLPLSGVIAPPSGAYLTQTVHLNDVSLRFEIWDTAGQEKYHSVTPLYYRGAHVALIVYDISDRVGEEQQVEHVAGCPGWFLSHCGSPVASQQTFVRAQLWLRELEKQSIPGSTLIWLVGNKGDLNHERCVSTKVQKH